MYIQNNKSCKIRYSCLVILFAMSFMVITAFLSCSSDDSNNNSAANSENSQQNTNNNSNTNNSNTENGSINTSSNTNNSSSNQNSTANGQNTNNSNINSNSNNDYVPTECTSNGTKEFGDACNDDCECESEICYLGTLAIGCSVQCYPDSGECPDDQECLEGDNCPFGTVCMRVGAGNKYGCLPDLGLNNGDCSDHKSCYYPAN